ncbi:hypothetical protein Cflav_PD5172 [Pedosphaera parvula Ellin514]|uniref:Uncharacterized protein n=1 Tax=Pedosphaera parvula (strain Ellin514) TaxID=320771 RepID=B9XC69_PEDPL|nr:hypothetical protein Cflav_PD5172 [Pedosphaera parvula Ellin514]
MQQTISDAPEPEFYILLFFSGAVFAVCALIAAGLFILGRRTKSKTLKIAAAVPLGCGTVVFAPMLLLLILWIGYWIFGNKPSVERQSQPGPPTSTNYVK